MKEFAEQFYKSKTWQDCRRSFIDKRRMIDGGMCQQCHQKLGYIVHHKIELTPTNIYDDTISLNHYNLMYVCHDCHNKIHEVWQPRSRTFFDENGNVFPREPSSPHDF